MPYLKDREILKLYKQHLDCPTVTLKQLCDQSSIEKKFESFEELESAALGIRELEDIFNSSIDSVVDHFIHIDIDHDIEEYRREYIGRIPNTRDNIVDYTAYSFGTLTGTSSPYMAFDDLIVEARPFRRISLRDLETFQRDPRGHHRYGILLQDIAFYYELWKQRGILAFKRLDFLLYEFLIDNIISRSRDPTIE